jgi:two-component system chemotaxis response regulator CheB
VGAAGRIDAIVIGASAGGVEALSVLLPACRLACAPIFIVLHLPRERPSLLAEIFAPKCACQVKEAEDKNRVEPGTVYFAPPDYHLLLDEGPQLALSLTSSCTSRDRPSMCCSNPPPIFTPSASWASF